jgi:hypothetical protein|tara:strand:+ start:271 stop:708 length:438 start_codon:yes stop_codon:yes gene_type:complete
MGNCCCNEKTKLQSCKCSETSGVGYNIVSPSKDSDNTYYDLIMSVYGPPPNLDYNKSDVSFWADRIGCTDDIKITFSSVDPNVDKVWYDLTYSPTFVMIGSRSLAYVDIKITLVAPVAPATVIDVLTTWEGCGTKKTQVGKFVIP